MVYHAHAQLLSHIWLSGTPVAPQGLSVHGIILARILEWVAISFSGDLSDPGIEPMFPASPALAGRFFTSVPPGKLPWLIIGFVKLEDNCFIIVCEFLLYNGVNQL